jgi:hypothetical protein
MPRLLGTLIAAAAGLALAAPAFAQDDAALPYCSASVTDHCRQHEGGPAKTHAMKPHHAHAKAKAKAHHRAARHHAAKKRHAARHHAAKQRKAVHAANAAAPAVPAHKQ